ncbi:MAG: hypothetical protein IT208_11720 [Chthonomonadales bacterium]|nr:hypothetical protein [Chthonomonadales bacterium]
MNPTQGARGSRLVRRAALAALLVAAAWPPAARAQIQWDAELRTETLPADPPQLALVIDHASTYPRGRAKVAGDSRRDLLAQLATKLDYTLEWPRPNVALLRKRFDDRRERPQFALSEMRGMARRALRLLGATNLQWAGKMAAGKEWGDRLRELAASLSAEQVEALRLGRQLTPADLTSEQRSLLEVALVARVRGYPASFWAGLRDLLARVEDAYLTVDPGHAGQAEARLVVPGSPRAAPFFSLGSWSPAGPEPEPDPPPPPAEALRPGQAPERPRYLPDPSGDPLLQSVYPSRGRRTLGALLREVSESAVGGLRLEASPELEDHALTVEVAGLRAGTLMQVLALVGNWEWARREDGSRVLRVVEPRSPGSLSPDVAVERSLPRDLWSYLTASERGRAGRSPNASQIRSRADRCADDAIAELLEVCRRKLRPGERYDWARLRPADRENVLAVLVGRMLGEAVSDAARMRWESVADASRIQIRLENEGLTVYLPQKGGDFMGFGQNVLRDEMTGQPVRPGPGW